MTTPSTPDSPEPDLLAAVEALPGAVCDETGYVLTPSGATREDGLDAAWAEAEAALPEGWAIQILWGTTTEDRWAVSAGPFPSEFGDPSRVTGGPTPAAALLALAARLRADSSDQERP